MTTLIDDKMPQQVRMSFKKGLENSKPVQVGTRKMLPIDLDITKNESGDYIIKNPYLDKLSEIKVKPGSTGTVKRYNATFKEEDDIGESLL